MFEELKKVYIEDREAMQRETLFFIENGFLEKWNDAQKAESDKGIERYSTELRWAQYQAGEIDREKAVELAKKRFIKKHNRDTEKGLARIDTVASAPDLSFARVNVDFVKSSTWGLNPIVDCCTNNADTAGHASGCGYDKESAAVAEAFNKDNSLLKVLYTIKENGLKAGQSNKSATACTGHDNRNIIGYGAGYSVLPYFEGGVGVNCFWSILEKAGFKVSCNYGKRSNFYSVYKEN